MQVQNHSPRRIASNPNCAKPLLQAVFLFIKFIGFNFSTDLKRKVILFIIMKTLEQILKSKPVYLNDWKESKLFGLISDFEELNLSKSDYEATSAPYANVEYWKEKVLRAKSVLKEWKDKKIKILFASYSYQDYSGDAFVLFSVNDELFEVNGSHCSCYGLEGQWCPEKAVLKELQNRFSVGTFGKDSYCGNDFNSEFLRFLGFS